jgi:hypothetical protein
MRPEGGESDEDRRESGVAPAYRTEVVVDASVEAVWRVIADVTRTGEWSHECHRGTWQRGATAAAPGARFRGHNRSGWLRWSRVCEIVALEAPYRISWRTIPTPLFPDSTVWSIALEPVGTRTRVAQTHQTGETPRWFKWVVGSVVPTHLDRRGALTDDLHRIGTIAAREPHGAVTRH